MIHLIDISKSFHTSLGRKVVIAHTNLSIPGNRRIGILGPNGAGKSTLLNLIAGVEDPSEGTISTRCKISWPVGIGAGVHPELSGVENAAFIARVYGVNISDTIAFVRAFSELYDDMLLPVRTYSSGMRARLSFALSMAIDFDCYLMDEITAVGDARFQAKCHAMLQQRSANRGIIYVSHNEMAIRRMCEMAIVIMEGRLVPFESVDEALAAYHMMSRR